MKKRTSAEDMVDKLISYKKKSQKSYETIGREMEISGFTIFRWAKKYRKPTGLYLRLLEQYVSEAEKKWAKGIGRP